MVSPGHAARESEAAPAVPSLLCGPAFSQIKESKPSVEKVSRKPENTLCLWWRGGAGKLEKGGLSLSHG